MLYYKTTEKVSDDFWPPFESTDLFVAVRVITFSVHSGFLLYSLLGKPEYQRSCSSTMAADEEIFKNVLLIYVLSL